MTDPNSPIIDFYPTGMSIIQAYTQYLEVSLLYLIALLLPYLTFLSHLMLLDFEVDMNGKRFAWQVCLIKFAFILVFS